MDASRKIQRGIHVHLIQFLMCPESWVHIKMTPRFFLHMMPWLRTHLVYPIPYMYAYTLNISFAQFSTVHNNIP